MALESDFQYKMKRGSSSADALRLVVYNNVFLGHDYASIVTPIIGSDYSIVGYNVQLWLRDSRTDPGTYDAGYLTAQVWLT